MGQPLRVVHNENLSFLQPDIYQQHHPVLNQDQQLTSHTSQLTGWKGRQTPLLSSKRSDKQALIVDANISNLSRDDGEPRLACDYETLRAALFVNRTVTI